jgi:hypothetical protein
MNVVAKWLRPKPLCHLPPGAYVTHRTPRLPGQPLDPWTRPFRGLLTVGATQTYLRSVEETNEVSQDDQKGRPARLQAKPPPA